MTGFSKRKFSNITIIAISLLAMVNFSQLKFWDKPNRIIAWDVLSYYAYLPASFIYDDITLDFIETDSFYGDKFWPQVTPEGDKVIKTTMGVAWFYIPGFVAGHITAKLTGHNADGFSPPYRFFLQLGGIIFMIIALVMLRNLLLLWFSDAVAAATVALTAFGTSLYYYGTLESTYSHIYSFFLVVLVIRETIRFYDRPNRYTPAIIGFAVGLATLIRPSNIIIGMVFLLWNVGGKEDLIARYRMFLKRYNEIAVIALFFLLPWIPQLLYWKAITGEWFYYSYQDERFFFLNPHFIKGLFSFRKGLFIYSPVVLVMWSGIFLLQGKLKKLRPLLLLFTLINTWIIFSWWCWWYGGSYGQRPFIDTLGLYAIPLAAAIDYLSKAGRKLKYPAYILLLLLLSHGIFQTAQYYHGSIHWDSMTKAAWVDSFGRLDPSDRFQSLLEEPDYEKARKTGRE